MQKMIQFSFKKYAGVNLALVAPLLAEATTLCNTKHFFDSVPHKILSKFR